MGKVTSVSSLGSEWCIPYVVWGFLVQRPVVLKAFFNIRV